MTNLFVGLCVLIFALTLAMGGLEQLRGLFGGMRHSSMLRWGAAYSGGTFPSQLLAEEPWRYLSAMFLHLGVLHIIFNSMALFDFGRAIEQRLGSARFVLIFLGTGVFGFVLSDLWYSLRYDAMVVPTAGASGGLFGLAAALVGYLYARRDPAYKDYLVHLAIMGAILGIALPVNNAAHVGGFVAGAPLGYLFYRENRPWRRARLMNWVAGLLVVASLGSIALSQRSPQWQVMRQIEHARGMR
jgi:rhomboid protease GluP